MANALAFSKGYLNGGKGQEPAPEQAGEGHGDIHEHLQQMHEATGHAHSHVEHHGDGTHTSHHIHEDGTVEGPHEHPDTASMAAKMQEMGEPESGEQPDAMGE